MNRLNSIDLIEKYKQLRAREANATSNETDAIDLVIVCSELVDHHSKVDEY